MFQTFKNAWKIPELRKKILFTILIILLYRIGANLFIPYVDISAIADNQSWAESYGGIFQLINLFSGGSFSNATFFALSVTPYITASIVMQLLAVAIPALERLSKEEDGREKINKYTRWVTVGLALVTAYGYINLLNTNSLLQITCTHYTNADNVYEFADGTTATFFDYFFEVAVMMACLSAGAAIIMWLAEKVNTQGIGNGISIILFANIISRFGADVATLYNMIADPILDEAGVGSIILGIVEALFSVALTVVAIVFIIWFTNSERRIKILYAKKTVGRKMYGGSNSNLPLKLNMAGVMPVIFASSIASLPLTVAAFFQGTSFYTWVNKWLGTTSVIYIAAFIIMIYLFSYFYISISFNPIEVANNIRTQGGAIAGIRPKEMAPYIRKILNRVTLMGAVFLTVISGVPLIVNAIVTACGGNFDSIAFTGTSLLIVVGVALETVQALEAQMTMRNYKGFLD